MTPLAGLSSGYSIAYGVSADGSAIVGLSQGDIGPVRAFRWTSGHGAQDLGELSPGAGGAARGVSADGGVVVGTSANRAMMWTGATGRWLSGSGLCSMSKEVTRLLPLKGNGTIVLADSTPGMARTRGRN